MFGGADYIAGTRLSRPGLQQSYCSAFLFSCKGNILNLIQLAISRPE